MLFKPWKQCEACIEKGVWPVVSYHVLLTWVILFLVIYLLTTTVDTVPFCSAGNSRLDLGVCCSMQTVRSCWAVCANAQPGVGELTVIWHGRFTGSAYVEKLDGIFTIGEIYGITPSWSPFTSSMITALATRAVSWFRQHPEITLCQIHLNRQTSTLLGMCGQP